MNNKDEIADKELLPSEEDIKLYVNPPTTLEHIYPYSNKMYPYSNDIEDEFLYSPIKYEYKKQLPPGIDKDAREKDKKRREKELDDFLAK